MDNFSILSHHFSLHFIVLLSPLSPYHHSYCILLPSSPYPTFHFIPVFPCPCISLSLSFLVLFAPPSFLVFIYHLSFIIYHLSFIIYHLSFIIYHLSFIIYHLSFIICHLSFVIYHFYFYFYFCFCFCKICTLFETHLP